MAKPFQRRTATGTLATKSVPAPVRKAPPPPPDLIYYEDIVQGEAEWFDARLGKATSSEFGTIMSGSDEALTRTKLLRQLAGEILTGEPRQSFSNKHTERGKALEPEVRTWYQQTKMTPVRTMGFVWNPEINAGWSPDGLIGDDGALEIKTVLPELLIGILERGIFPAEHRPQCFGGAFLVGRRQWCDLVVYAHAKMPKFVARLTPNADYQRQIRNAIEVFNWDLGKLVERMRKLGV